MFNFKKIFKLNYIIFIFNLNLKKSREYLSNLTNKSHVQNTASALSENGHNASSKTTLSSLTIRPKTLYSDYVFQNQSENNQLNNNAADELQGSTTTNNPNLYNYSHYDNDSEGDGDKSFDNLYTCEYPPSVITADLDDSTNPSSMSNQNSILIKSSQMTPPKSVESIQFQPQLQQQQLMPNSTSGVNTTTTTTSHSIPPISYDDLNNIFEEESSTDEQQPSVSHQQQNQWVHNYFIT